MVGVRWWMYSCYCTWIYIAKFNTLQKLCHLNDQMIDNQIYFINSTRNTIRSQFIAGTQIRQLSYLYWFYKQLERRTWNAIATPVFFCISLPRLAQWLVFSLFLTITTSSVPSSLRHGVPATVNLTLQPHYCLPRSQEQMYLVINFQNPHFWQYMDSNIGAFVVTVRNYFESTEPNAVLWD